MDYKVQEYILHLDLKTRFPFKVDVGDPDAVYRDCFFIKQPPFVDIDKSKIKPLLCLNLPYYSSFQLSLHSGTAP